MRRTKQRRQTERPVPETAAVGWKSVESSCLIIRSISVFLRQRRPTKNGKSPKLPVICFQKATQSSAEENIFVFQVKKRREKNEKHGTQTSR